MTFYQFIAKHGPRFVKRSTVFRLGLNWTPLYRRTTGRIESVSDDLHRIVISVPLSYRNRNYIGSVFGGSLFAAADPVPMAQLINLLDSEYVVWDKAAHIRFKRPAFERVVAESVFTAEELIEIRQQVEARGELEWVKTVVYRSCDGTRVFCEIDKVLYVATKAHYKAKQARRVRP